MGIWAIRSPLKIHCYTCMSFETCWSRLIYTKLSSHRSFVINMYVITMAWRCISPWSFHRSLQRRREMDIFYICQQFSTFWSKKIQKKKKRKAGWKFSFPKMYESYRDLFLIVILCHNWYMSLVKRLIFTQCMYGMWIDNLFKTSQKKKLGNVCTRYYVDFIFFSAIERLRNFCRVFLWTNTTLKDTYLCFRVISSSCCKTLYSEVKDT